MKKLLLILLFLSACARPIYETAKTPDGRFVVVKTTPRGSDTIYVVPDFTQGEGFLFEYIKAKK